MTPTPQPKALELASTAGQLELTAREQMQVAAELRRQHAEIEALKTELQVSQYWGPKWESERDSRVAAEAERDSLRAEVERLRADAEHIANIAHAGGLCELPEGEALALIRKLTCRYWPRGKGMKDRVRAALDAAREAKG